MKKILFMLLFIVFPSQQTLSLEIDEKLTTRILKVSQSKKTILLNRGLEDGLVEGDHAKFFLTSGVIARGVLTKASPTRSIWSVYRIVDNDSLFPDKVVNIKISSPVKLTEDASKSVYGEEDGDSSVQVIRGDQRFSSVAPQGEVMSMDDRKEIMSMKGTPSNESITRFDKAGENKSRDVEVFGLVHLNSLSSSVEYGDRGSSTGQMAQVDFSLGIEKYFYKPGSMLGQISVMALIHSGQNQVGSIQGQQVTTNVLEYGLGVNWHFMASAFSYNKLIGFATAGFGVGNASDSVELLNPETTQEAETVEGSSSFFFAGVGMKYFTKAGFGVRAIIDYYQRGESYTIENLEGTYSKTLAGPRIMMGLAYRF